MSAPAFELNDGNAIPAVGYGTGMVQPDDVEDIVPKAISLGYRHIDTAASYGNEEAVGHAIRNSDVDRSELFVTTKVPGTGHGFDEARRALDESLDKLGLDYVDLYLIHWPLPDKDRYVDTWKALIELQKNGKARSIGVSNFLPEHLDRIIDTTDVIPAANQIQLYPGLTRQDLRRYHDEKDIVTLSWSPLGLGATTRFFGGNGEAIESAPVRRLAEKYDRTAAQIILRWHTQLGLVPVSRSSKLERLQQSLDTFAFELTSQELESITALDDGSEQPEDPKTHSE